MNDAQGSGRGGDERSEQVRAALLKALVVVVVIGVLIAVGTTIVVRALGLNESDAPGPGGAAPDSPVAPLPTTALPVPGEDQPTKGPSESPGESASAGPSQPAGSSRIMLQVSPVTPRPNERVNLTGTYKGADNAALEVQRFEGGSWTNFGVNASVHVGTYATYITTGRSGEQRFRMFDPATNLSSNVVLVTVG